MIKNSIQNYIFSNSLFYFNQSFYPVTILRNIMYADSILRYMFFGGI